MNGSTSIDKRGSANNGAGISGKVKRSKRTLLDDSKQENSTATDSKKKKINNRQAVERYTNFQVDDVVWAHLKARGE